jgi:hypothetical protein
VWAPLTSTNGKLTGYALERNGGFMGIVAVENVSEFIGDTFGGTTEPPGGE